MNRNAQNLAIPRLPTADSFPPISSVHRPESRASTESVSSAEERLQWRSHPNVATPLPDPTGQNPFDDSNLALSSSLDHESRKLENDASEQVRKEEVEEVYRDNARAHSSSSEKTEQPGPLVPVTSNRSTRRSAQGRTKREIIRCLKRYIARELLPLIREALANQPPSIAA